MTKHYLVRDGYTVHDQDGNVLGEAGDTISLETDSSDRATALAAEGLLRAAGGSNAVCAVSTPPGGKKGKKGKKPKKASYKTREMTAEPEPAEAEPEAEEPEEDEAG